MSLHLYKAYKPDTDTERLICNQAPPLHALPLCNLCCQSKVKTELINNIFDKYMYIYTGTLRKEGLLKIIVSSQISLEIFMPPINP